MGVTSGDLGVLRVPLIMVPDTWQMLSSLVKFFIFLYLLSIHIFYLNMFFVFFNKEFLLAIQKFILLMNSSY
jgi:hypothetical protein